MKDILFVEFLKGAKMKKLLLVICICFFMIGCGNARTFNGRYCDTYGLFNKEDKCENVRYKLIVGNLFWAIVFSEIIIVPIYFFGFSLFEPVEDMSERMK